MNKIISRLFLILLFLGGQALNASADIYKWVDQAGTVHYTDDFGSIPDGYSDKYGVIITSNEPQKEFLNKENADDVYFVPFVKTPAGIILVDVVLNDYKQVKMIFDTGANLVVISEDLAKALGGEYSRNGQRVKLRTAGGEIEGIASIIQKIELGNAYKENVRAVVHGLPGTFDGFDGLLGLSFLEDFKITIDYQNNRIVLKRSL